jgi:hypothetical protein
MPSWLYNINRQQFLLLPKYVYKSVQKIMFICNNVTSCIVKKRGFNVISKILGLFQGVFIHAIERKALISVFMNNVNIYAACQEQYQYQAAC